ETTEARTKYKAQHSDKLNPTYTDYTSKAEQQKRLWPSIAEYVSQQGGWVISSSHAWPMRLEVRKESALPAKLSEFYTLHHVGSTMLVAGCCFLKQDILNLTLPKSAR